MEPTAADPGGGGVASGLLAGRPFLDIDINDCKTKGALTRKQTHEEVTSQTGASIVIRGRYKPPGDTSTDERPLHLHLEADTQEAIERAEAILRELMGPPPEPAPGGAYLKHIQERSGCRVQLSGKGCSTVDGGLDTRPLHISISAPSPEALELGRTLAESLVKAVRDDFEKRGPKPPPGLPPPALAAANGAGPAVPSSTDEAARRPPASYYGAYDGHYGGGAGWQGHYGTGAGWQGAAYPGHYGGGEKSNALVGDGVLQPAPRSANLDSAFDGMQLFACDSDGLALTGPQSLVLRLV
ncbi:hypothetical protein EMIHUDRAFT_228400 [Emiliania huxleyi CCMP1516]|uniref:Branchpoint-bridging protein n=2 Tax=Emiliania huxleyi TaxID=2903 RepID=A0A0D3KFW2_EMIH1|nr:hypothetical protein EMIHUDRAFT_228400 [Emiliania huxleyi CCMP1516]EOD34647.1 hypothetical protein EMIHUDRAFT_228400 [Emiliania huxleyi CCMP1516]|eukprot:XP_005787076.1 hypothetical protein EMIHUDRAFT_228400 [Emiliania huxleyi CCMP1516]